MEFGGWEDGENLGGAEGEETVIRIYYKKTKYFQLKKKRDPVDKEP